MRVIVRGSGVVAVLVAAVWGMQAGAQTPLAAAKESYAAADYDHCLRLLDSVPPSLENRVDAGEYRALCLMALRREDDAVKVVEALVRQEPLYQPSPSSPPRLKGLVLNVKRAVLPELLQESYAAAKISFDARRYEEAASGFRAVVALIDDPGLNEQRSPLLRDIKTISSGFIDVIEASRIVDASVAAAPAVASDPPPTDAPPVVPAPPVAPSPAPPAAVIVPPPISATATDGPPRPGVTRGRVFTALDPDVTAPLTLDQTLPPWRTVPGVTAVAPYPVGRLEIIINETGAVESATLLKPTYREYDDRLLRAARKWQYTPAKRGGQPVKFGKVIEITLSSE